MVAVDHTTKKRGRPKLTLEAVVQTGLSFSDIKEHDALDSAQWRKRIHVADPNWLRLKARFGFFNFVMFDPYVTSMNFLLLLLYL